MWNANHIVKLKESYLEEYKELKNKTQIGLSIHMEYHYLLTNDFQNNLHVTTYSCQRSMTHLKLRKVENG